MSVRRPVWSFFVPTTLSAKVRTVSFAAPTILFGLAAAAMLMKQGYYRNALEDEDCATWERVERRAYVALPDGRSALVHPQIDARVTGSNLWHSFVDFVNPLP